MCVPTCSDSCQSRCIDLFLFLFFFFCTAARGKREYGPPFFCRFFFFFFFAPFYSEWTSIFRAQVEGFFYSLAFLGRSEAFRSDEIKGGGSGKNVDRFKCTVPNDEMDRDNAGESSTDFTRAEGNSYNIGESDLRFLDEKLSKEIFVSFRGRIRRTN